MAAGEPFEIDPDKLVVPEGYHLSNNSVFGWFVVRDDGSADYRLTDRSFGDVHTVIAGQETNDIDYWSGYTISAAIEEAIARKGKAVIVDVACGPLNKAAFQIAKTYGEKVLVKAVDLIGSNQRFEAENFVNEWFR